MASYLGAYPTAAKNRDEKLKRAINSVLMQSYPNWELVVVADGCDKTADIVAEYADNRIQCYKIDKQPLWSGNVRNTGIRQASGDYIIYLDNDDVFGPAHIRLIAEGIQKHPDHDWYFFNDMIPIGTKFTERQCAPHKFKCGTSNIAHRPDVAMWNIDDTYDHDWNFMRKLMKAGTYARIDGQYCVCHIPKKFDI